MCITLLSVTRLSDATVLVRLFGTTMRPQLGAVLLANLREFEFSLVGHGVYKLLFQLGNLFNKWFCINKIVNYQALHNNMVYGFLKFSVIVF